MFDNILLCFFQTERSLIEGQQLFEKEKRKYSEQISLLQSKLKVNTNCMFLIRQMY